jgi:hypothetical protein
MSIRSQAVEGLGYMKIRRTCGADGCQESPRGLSKYCEMHRQECRARFKARLAEANREYRARFLLA